MLHSQENDELELYGSTSMNLRNILLNKKVTGKHMHPNSFYIKLNTHTHKTGKKKKNS